MKIKLVASDMDGTLLQGDRRVVSDEQLELIGKLIEKGVLFAPASGRQYTNLQNNFAPVKDKIIYICENGSLVKYKGETLYKNKLDRSLGLDIMNDIYSREDCEVLLSGEGTSYLVPKSEEYVDYIVNSVKNHVTIVNSFDDVKEDFLKISVYCGSGIGRHSQYFADRWGTLTKATVSGSRWQDFVPTDVNKGTAIKRIQEKLGIAVEETMAFGDNYNDIEMFERASYSYAMDNAVDDIKKAAKYTSPDVESVLRDMCRK